jgi:hypothetical protein
MPKRGFVNMCDVVGRCWIQLSDSVFSFRRELQPVNIDKILYFGFTGRLDLNAPITIRALRDAGVIKRVGDGVKLLSQVCDSTQSALLL